MNDIKELKGKTIIDIKTEETYIIFTCSDGSVYKMYHYQDCCEIVVIDDIWGDLKTLLNSPITYAEKSMSHEDIKPNINIIDSSVTWTFYKLATINGWVDIRWFGTSNGYYSEEVDFEKID